MKFRAFPARYARALAACLCSSCFTLRASAEEAQGAAPAPISARAAEPPPTTVGWPQQAAAFGLAGGINLGLWYWVSQAWWARKDAVDGFLFHNEGYFGPDTYAGGADKLGHMWAAYALNFGTSKLLAWGGLRPNTALGVATASTFVFLTAAEFKDAHHKNFGWSWGDIYFNLGGQAFAVAQTLVPALDERLDFRVSYFPSPAYREAVKGEGALNAPEDYSGMAFILAYQLSSVKELRENDFTRWMRYLNPYLGYRTRGYKPTPLVPTPRRRQLMVGLALDFRALLDELADTRSAPPDSARSLADMATKLYQPPYTMLPALTLERVAPPLPP